MSKKPLPSINHPTLSIELPVSKNRVKYRPFVVREQQVLLLAQQSEDPDSIHDTISEVLTSCTGGTVDLDTISLCDLSYLFLQMHIASVGPELTIKAKCSNEECGSDILMNFDLSLVGVSEMTDTNVKLTNEVGMIMRYPTYKDTVELTKLRGDSIAAVFLLVDSIYDADSVYAKNDYTLEEFREWLLSMSDDQLKKVYYFVDKIPDICYDLEYHCPNCKTKHSKRLEGLQTFFRISSKAKLD
jgi:hypothetical protein